MRNSCPRRCYEGNKLSNMLIDKTLCNPYFLRTIYKCNAVSLLVSGRYKDHYCYNSTKKKCACSDLEGCKSNC